MSSFALSLFERSVAMCSFFQRRVECGRCRPLYGTVTRLAVGHAGLRSAAADGVINRYIAVHKCVFV